MFRRNYCTIFVASLAIVLLFLKPAFADSNLDVARRHLELGEYADAIQLAAKLPMEYALDAALIKTRAHIGLGNYQAAKASGKIAVKISSRSYDARFLYALALERSGEAGHAVVQYRRAIDFASSAGQIRNAAASIRRIESKKSVSFSGSLGLAPSTNFDKVTSNDEVDLVFGTAQITSADPTGDVAVTYSAIVAIRQVPDLTFGTSGLLARDSSSNQLTGAIDYKTTNRDGSTVSAGFQTRWVSGQLFQNRVTLSSGFPTKFADQVNVGIDAISYAGGGSEVSPAISISKKLLQSDEVRVTGSVRAKRHGSTDPEYAAISGGISISAHFEVGKFDTQIAGSLNLRNWDSAYSLFPEPRQDQDQILSLVVSPNNASLLGLRPTARASFLKRQSNIAIYEIQSQDFYFGYEANF